MIYLYTGTPGSGKSLHLAQDIIFKLKRGHGVIANFPIDSTVIKKKKLGNFIYKDNSELTVDFLKKYAFKNHVIGKEGQCLLCIDEAQVIFNSREFNNKDRMEWIKFFSQHRKLGYNVILIAQNDRMLDRQIRSLVEYEYKHRKVNNYGIGMFLPVATFCCVQYWYGVKEKLGVDFFFYKKIYNKIYDSYALFGEVGESSGAAGEPNSPNKAGRKSKIAESSELASKPATAGQDIPLKDELEEKGS